MRICSTRHKIVWGLLRHHNGRTFIAWWKLTTSMRFCFVWVKTESVQYTPHTYNGNDHLFNNLYLSPHLISTYTLTSSLRILILLSPISQLPAKHFLSITPDNGKVNTCFRWICTLPSHLLTNKGLVMFLQPTKLLEDSCQGSEFFKSLLPSYTSPLPAHSSLPLSPISQK